MTESSDKRPVPADDAPADPKKRKVEDVKTGVLYELKCVYQQLLRSKKPRESQRLIDDILSNYVGCKKSLTDSAHKLKMTPAQSGANPGVSKALQMCLKRGTKEQRLSILTYYETTIPELLLTSEGGDLVEKVLRYCPKLEVNESEEKSKSRPEQASAAKKKEQDDMVNKVLAPLMKASSKILSKIFFHKHGSKSLVSKLFPLISKQSVKNGLINAVVVPKSISLLFGREVYDPYRCLNVKGGLLQSEVFLKSEALENELLPHLKELVDRLIDKELFENNVVAHQILLTYCECILMARKRNNAEENPFEAAFKNFAENQFPIAAANLLLSTRPGVEALNHIVGFLSAKSKKTLIKQLKSKFLTLSKNSVCYMLVIRLLMTTDDTVLSQKSILQELLEDSCEGAEERFVWDSSFGRRVLLAVLEPPTSINFSPWEIERLFELPAPTALKDSNKRRNELRQWLVGRVLEKFNKEIAGYSLVDKLSCQQHWNSLAICFLSLEKEKPEVETMRKKLEDFFIEELKTQLVDSDKLLNNSIFSLSLCVLLRKKPSFAASVCPRVWNEVLFPRIMNSENLDLKKLLESRTGVTLFTAVLAQEVEGAKEVLKGKETLIKEVVKGLGEKKNASLKTMAKEKLGIAI